MLENQSIVALEYCCHGNLQTYIEKKRGITDQRLLKFLFLQVCSAVNECHTSAKVAHLDIKHNNVLISSQGVLKLCDFGLAESVDKKLTS